MGNPVKIMNVNRGTIDALNEFTRRYGGKNGIVLSDAAKALRVRDCHGALAAIRHTADARSSVRVDEVTKARITMLAKQSGQLVATIATLAVERLFAAME